MAGCERSATAALIVHLAEFDARRLFESAGYPSLFQYCVCVLRLSEDAVYNRIEVARAVRQYPAIACLLQSGALSPTTARLVAGHLTPENHEELLRAVSGKSKRGVDELLAHWCPQPDVTARVRPLPSPGGGQEAVTSPGPGTRPESSSPLSSGEAASPPADPLVSPAARQVVRPLAPKRYEIRFTASAEMRERLREAQDLLGHAVPSGDIAEVFDRALIQLVLNLRKRKFAATANPCPVRQAHSNTSSHVPAEVKRAVTARDQARCAFVATGGHHCGERRFLEFHHVWPRGAGGEATIENIQLRCRAHNGHEVDVFYGPGKRWTSNSPSRTDRGSRAACASARERRDSPPPPSPSPPGPP